MQWNTRIRSVAPFEEVEQRDEPDEQRGEKHNYNEPTNTSLNPPAQIASVRSETTVIAAIRLNDLMGFSRGW